MCETFHALPEAGGVYDQNPYLMESMKLVMAARAEKAEKDSKK